MEELTNLNPTVDVQVVKGYDVAFLASNFECVVISDNYDAGFLIELNKACHAKNVGREDGGTQWTVGWSC